ncbi:MAG: response regulator [Opitutaceae bacterium]|nr:response regulator [Cephaloticoccus sp.]MCP5530633.1 response regulator [Opitutaceae bacterium]
MSHPLPANESERLQSLHDYRILDTLPEQEYDDLAALAAQICDVPISAISLIDETRQWFKARVGLNDSETSRDTSFCAHAICEPDNILIVPDAERDRRFMDNPLVRQNPHIRFYAGAPLVSSSGHALGALCVIDRKPRQLTEEQLKALGVLRRHVVTALELRRMVHEQKTNITRLQETQSALEAARRQAEEATLAKSRFLASMSHEIRTPMNAIIGMTTILRDTSLNSEQKDCVETVANSGEVLLELINDILDFSKIEAGHLELERTPFNVRECVDTAISLLETPAQAKGLALHAKVDPTVPEVLTGDVTRLRQVIINLLSNAVKFTSSGSVTLQVSARSTPAGQVELAVSVSDTGIGIAPDRLDRLFQHFSQAESSTTRRFGGTGLGLAISKRLVELHGGRIWVESTPGQGTVFKFTVTAGVAQTAEATPSALPEARFDVTYANRHPCRLLLAEDNIVNQKVAQQLLKRLGYKIDTAGNGLDVIAMLQKEPYDLVLMDVEMPELDGLGATERIRREFPVERQPVIAALTANAVNGDRERFLAKGMDEYLSKPLRIEQLMALLARTPELLGRHRQTGGTTAN